MNFSQKKQVFGFTKHKAYGLCGAMLLSLTMFGIASTSASADEVTSGDNQFTISTESDSAQIQKQQDELNKQVEDSTNKAESQGVTVESKPEVVHTDLNQAKEDVKTQIEKMDTAGSNSTEANSQINKAIEDAQKNGTVVEKGQTYTLTSEEALAKAKEIADEISKTDQSNVENRQKYESALADYNKQKDEVDKKNEEIRKENERISKDNAEKQAKYDSDKAKHDDYMKSQEENKDKDGYLKDPNSQNLVFEKEPNAVVNSVTGTAKDISSQNAIDELVKRGYSRDYANQIIINHLGAKFEDGISFKEFKINDSLEIEYKLSNSRFGNEAIDKVVYKFTLKKSDIDYSIATFSKDPTDGFFYSANQVNTTPTEYELEIHFYGKDGEEIIPKDSLFSFSSLNSNNGHYEYVKDFNGKFIEFSGSSVTAQDNSVYAKESNDFTKFEGQTWDTAGGKYSYYGAAAGKMGDTPVKFTVGSTGRINWFRVNSRIESQEYMVNPPTPELEKETPSEEMTIEKPDAPTYQSVKSDKIVVQSDTHKIAYKPYKDSIPVKTVKNGKGEDANDSNVVRGDTLVYDMIWDLSGIDANHSYDKADEVSGLSFYDDYDESKVTAQEDLISVTDKDGNRINDQFDIVFNKENGSVDMKVKDVESFVKSYGGQKLNVKLFVKVNKDVFGDLENTAVQNNFGNKVKTETVINHIPKINPSKDVTIEIGGQSIDGKEVKLGEIINYELNSSNRPSNIKTDTDKWSITDILSEKDEFTGQVVVHSNTQIVRKDGSLIQKGEDITSEFDIQSKSLPDGKTEVSISAKQSFLDLINLDANKLSEIGWKTYLQVKRVGSGEVENTLEESYNGETIKSNSVKTFTPKPKDPIKVAPEIPKSVVPVKVEYSKTELPKTSSNAGLLGLYVSSVIGLFGLGSLSKKKTK